MKIKEILSHKDLEDEEEKISLIGHFDFGQLFDKKLTFNQKSTLGQNRIFV